VSPHSPLCLFHPPAVSVLDSADIEVTDSRLPHPIAVDHQPQSKSHHASKPSQTSGQFCVELVRGSAGFGLTLSGGHDVNGDAPLAVRGLLKHGPAQRCGRLQVGDLVLHINGESTQGLTHAQVVERIRTGGPRLRLVLYRPLKTHPGKPESVGRSQIGGDRSPDPGEPEVMRSRSSSTSPVRHPRSRTTHKTRDSLEPSPEAAAHGPAVPPREDRIPGSPGPWLVPSEERLSRALGVSGAAQLAQEMSAGRRRH
uniref:MAGI family member, X-linked n=1 Tax=Prolemur simus TaxID=1328070 RepID=A0A8C9DLD0_PROSS